MIKYNMPDVYMEHDLANDEFEFLSENYYTVTFLNRRTRTSLVTSKVPTYPLVSRLVNLVDNQGNSFNISGSENAGEHCVDEYGDSYREGNTGKFYEDDEPDHGYSEYDENEDYDNL